MIRQSYMHRVASRARDCRKNIGMPANIQTCCGKKNPNPEKCRKRKDRLKSKVTVVCITFRKQRTTSILIGSFQPINRIRFHLLTSGRCTVVHQSQSRGMGKGVWRPCTAVLSCERGKTTHLLSIQITTNSSSL